MAVDLDSKATKDLQTIIANCVRLNRTGDPMFAAANAILATRLTGEYNMDKTVAAIIRQGRLRSFLSFKDIADASGLNWVKSRRGVVPHLEALSFHSAGKGWPMLASIVVNKDRVDTGEMTADNLRAFIDGVREAGVEVDIDDLEYLKREQQRVFAWCRQEN